ncbi:MAG: hypothetical protein GY913_06455 [Proteobacteria bacterium]|nr:hypothetical protein [Pseudomonadota bacterium]MCP4916547.1 hypothetical protein [Pseudomonadota bacterium]
MKAARALPMIGAVAALTLGIAGGLARAGAPVPIPGHAIADHGALMVAGFLGTLIAVERAVALDRAWGWAAPVLSALGALALVAGHPDIAAPLLVAGSAGLVASTVATAARQPSDFGVVLGVGALMLATANALWWAGQPVFQIAPWWCAFLVFTIAGERLELSRLTPRGPLARWLFAAIGVIYLLGLVWTRLEHATGVQLIGAAQVGLAAWLIRYDIARRTIRRPGLTRYIAVALLSGYAWLAVGGALSSVAAAAPSGLLYDAMLHAVLVGFVIAMIFGHAPIVLPAVLGTRSPWHPAMYLGLGVLHLSVLARIAGDLAAREELRTVGSYGHVAAIVLFAAAAVTGLATSRSPALSA